MSVCRSVIVTAVSHFQNAVFGIRNGLFVSRSLCVNFTIVLAPCYSEMTVQTIMTNYSIYNYRQSNKNQEKIILLVNLIKKYYMQLTIYQFCFVLSYWICSRVVLLSMLIQTCINSVGSQQDIDTIKYNSQSLHWVCPKSVILKISA